MATVVFGKIEWYPKINNNNYSNTATIITELLQFREDESASSNYVKSNSFQFDLKLSSTSSSIKIDDRIVIYGYKNGTYYKLIDGFVSNTEYYLDNTRRQVTIRGRDRSAYLMSSIVASGYLKTDSINKVHLIIQNLIARVNDTLPTPKKISYDTSSIKQLKKDNTAFPDINFSAWYEPLYSQINKLCSSDYTEDGTYTFYIDSNNKAFFEPYYNNEINTLTTNNCQAITSVFTTDDTVNFYIIHAGNDAYGDGIITFEQNDSSRLQYGAKHKFKDLTKVADKLINDEQIANPDKFDDASGRFPTDAALADGYQMLFIDTDLEPDARAIVYNKKDYNSQIKKAAIIEAKKQALKELNTLGVGQWKVSAQLQGTVSYVKNSKVTVSIPEIGWSGANAKQLRVVEVQHNLTNKGWTTDIELQEVIV